MSNRRLEVLLTMLIYNLGHRGIVGNIFDHKTTIETNERRVWIFRPCEFIAAVPFSSDDPL